MRLVRDCSVTMFPEEDGYRYAVLIVRAYPDDGRATFTQYDMIPEWLVESIEPLVLSVLFDQIYCELEERARMAVGADL